MAIPPSRSPDRFNGARGHPESSLECARVGYLSQIEGASSKAARGVNGDGSASQRISIGVAEFEDRKGRRTTAKSGAQLIDSHCTTAQWHADIHGTRSWLSSTGTLARQARALGPVAPTPETVRVSTVTSPDHTTFARSSQALPSSLLPEIE
ncbi:hypothetical protein B0H67DRAFT_638976 [Lasiosphaeris hirsuta]|uniref:Uncharacterized protein n=1 Tax=Lasiosphaeris hirsuta TaxID=260670 RepID=A0AA40E9X9_9PEZI|nr:hypothetical protein B0H67DRAFT_638976 [Lasiosphaeris hirsuta]